METPENKNDVFEPMPEEAAAQVTAENSADGNRSQKMAKQRRTCLQERFGASADWLSVSYPTISRQPGAGT